METTDKIKFSYNNSKIKATGRALELKPSQIACFDLPAGWSCPNANICKGKADRDTGKAVYYGSVPCYAVKAESCYKQTRVMRWHNFDLFRQCGTNIDRMVGLITKSWDFKLTHLRLHSAGDFYNKAYFMAWVEFARVMPNVQFYGYTKILDYVKYSNPYNFNLTYSYGSTDDKNHSPLIPTCYIRTNEPYDNGQTFITLDGPMDVQCDVICNEDNDISHGMDYSYIKNHISFALNVH